MFLSDGYLANGSEPWQLPALADLPDLSVEFATELNSPDGDEFWPYLRDEETLARPWAVPGTPGLEHRVGGLEKLDGRGTISYDTDNHDHMVRLRQAKIDGIAKDIPPLAVDDPTRDGEPAPTCWSWAGARPTARSPQPAGASGATAAKVAHAHLRHLNPMPANTGDVLRRYRKVLIPEMNLGQLLMLIRARYLVDAVGYNQVRGLPFKAAELEAAIQEELADDRYRWKFSIVSRPRQSAARPRPQDRREADPQGLHVRPGRPLVPGLRRLRDPRHRPGLPARAGPEAGERRLRLRHRLLLALPVLRRDLRHALDPRPRAGDRDRAGLVAPRPVGVGGDR